MPVEFFFYCRVKPGTAPGPELNEAHWSFMDGYADGMIARGPTSAPDGTWSGSMHMVDLPDAEAARVFAFEEPNYRAGVYGEVLVRRWRNGLGRTMWDFDGVRGGRRFLIIGHGRPGVTAVRDGLLEEHNRYFADNGYQERFVARGPLSSDDGSEWIGSAMAIELPDRAAVEAMLAAEPYTRAGLYASVEIHDWEFGGRPEQRR
jgi:uncharacterized protein YciI